MLVRGPARLRPDASVDHALVEAASDALDANADAGPVITGLAIEPDPLDVLAATLTFTTDRPARGAALLVNDGAQGNTVQTPIEPALVTSHAIPLLGMREMSTFTVSLSVTDAQGRASTATTSFTTPAKPAWIPPILTVLNDPTRTSKGYTLLDLIEFSGFPAGLTGPGSGLVALDADFQVVWYRQGGGIDPEKLPNGDLVAIDPPGWWALDMLGRRVAGQPSLASLGLSTAITHAIQPEANGNFLSLAPELRDVPGFPGALDGGTMTLAVVGAQLLELPPDGGNAAVVADTFDFFDAHREGTPALFGMGDWDRVFPDAGPTYDWIHPNAISVDPTDGNIVASSRTQSWIYKVTRAGQLVWRLGYQGDFTLTNPDTDPPEASWQYNQHGSYVTPAGTIMCFDDGNARPQTPGCAQSDAGVDACYYSRAVEFSLDPTTMKATLVWQYGSPTYGDPDNLSSQVYGSSYVLPGGTVLVDDGCEISVRSSSTGDPMVLKWGRVIEVTHTTPAERIAEFDIKVPLGQYPPDPKYSGFGIYRAYRLPSLYAGSVGSADDGDL